MHRAGYLAGRATALLFEGAWLALSVDPLGYSSAMQIDQRSADINRIERLLQITSMVVSKKAVYIPSNEHGYK
jgi:hypothetical protein